MIRKGETQILALSQW